MKLAITNETLTHCAFMNIGRQHTNSNQLDQEGSIRKADWICFSEHATDTSHTAVQGFIHVNGKTSLGIVAR
jgi:hypothetical protein